MIASPAGTALYVYGVVPSRTAVPVGVELVSSDGLAAIVAHVGLDEFGDEPLRRNLEDRDWLERAASEHDRVLVSVIGTAPIVPFRFGTVYRDDAAIRAMLDERRPILDAALEHVRGRVELGVKAFLAEAPPERQASSGRDYLMRKQRARDERTDAIEAVHALHEHLASLADDARVNRPQPSELSGRGEPMLLNAAYLVPELQQPEFAAAAADHGEGSVEIVVTGPWPAYNFVGTQEDE